MNPLSFDGARYCESRGSEIRPHMRVLIFELLEITLGRSDKRRELGLALPETLAQDAERMTICDCH